MLEQMAKLSIQQGPPRPGPGAPRRAITHDVPQRLNRMPHFLAKAPTLRDCVACSNRNTRRHRTVYYCNTCTTKPYFCPDTCFQRYHTLANYKQSQPHVSTMLLICRIYIISVCNTPSNQAHQLVVTTKTPSYPISN